MKGYAGAISQHLFQMMKAVETQTRPVDHTRMEFSAAAMQQDHILYYILSNTTEAAAADTLMNCPEGHGLECWRRYSRR